MDSLPILYLSQREVEQLPEYSTSFPTGTAIGKRWLRDNRPRPHPKGSDPEWIIGEYVDHPDEKLVGIKWWRLIIVTDGELTRYDQSVPDDTINIETCPFCGAQPERNMSGEYVSCADDDCAGGGHWKTIEQWNRRA